MSRGSGPSPPCWLSEREEEAGASASGLLGPFHVHPVCKSTVLKPCIFTAANLEAMGNQKKFLKNLQ